MFCIHVQVPVCAHKFRNFVDLSVNYQASFLCASYGYVVTLPQPPSSRKLDLELHPDQHQAGLSCNNWYKVQCGAETVMQAMGFSVVS